MKFAHCGSITLKARFSQTGSNMIKRRLSSTPAILAYQRISIAPAHANARGACILRVRGEQICQ